MPNRMSTSTSFISVNDPFAKEKLFEAIDYFTKNVKYVGKVKLFKLLYYLDLMTFRRTGRSVTGLVYNAWPKGPVPVKLDDQFKKESSELRTRFDVTDSSILEESIDVTIDTDAAHLEAHSGTFTRIPTKIRSRRPVVIRHLTRREQAIAAELAEIFKELRADQMSDFSHGKFGPWTKAIARGKRAGIDRPEIDFMEGEVTVGRKEDELPLEQLRELVEESQKLRQAFS